MARLERSPELELLAPAAKDERGNVVEPERYTTREMLAVEPRMVEQAQEMPDTRTHGVGESNRNVVVSRLGYLSAEQRAAVSFITGERQIEALTGFGGVGKPVSRGQLVMVGTGFFYRFLPWRKLEASTRRTGSLPHEVEAVRCFRTRLRILILEPCDCSQLSLFGATLKPPNQRQNPIS
jgi:hypothetical protein